MYVLSNYDINKIQSSKILGRKNMCFPPTVPVTTTLTKPHIPFVLNSRKTAVLLIMQSMKVSDNIIPWQSTKNTWNSSAWLKLLNLDGTKMVEISRRPFSALPLQLSIFNLPCASIGSSTPWSSVIGLICKTTLLSLPCLRHLAAMQTFIFLWTIKELCSSD